MLSRQGGAGLDRRKTVPAPQPPLTIDQPLARRQLRLQAVPGFRTLDPTGLSEAARESGRSSYGFAQREGTLRQARAALDPIEGYPETRSGWTFVIGKRRQQLVFEHCSDRCLEARRDLHRGEDWRRRAGVGRRGDECSQPLDFRPQPSEPRLDLASRIESGLFRGEVFLDFFRSPFHDSAAILYTARGIGHFRRGGGNRFGRDEGDGRRRALLLGGVPLRCETSETFGEFRAAAFEAGAAGIGGGAGFSLIL